MSDLPPIPPCPSNPNGVHRMEGWALVSQDSDKASLTWTCRYCGALRQVTGFGPLYVPGTKDDLAPDEITALLDRSGWETR